MRANIKTNLNKGIFYNTVVHISINGTVHIVVILHNALLAIS